jgi:tetratricopeptide (TPR) repeat protein
MEGGALPLVTDVLTEWASPSADSTGDMAVPIVVEVAGAQLIDSLEEGDETGHLNLEAYVYALDDSGAVVDHLARAIAIELARFGEAFDTTGVRVVETVDLPAGTYSLRILVMDSASRVFGLSIKEIEVSASGGHGRTSWLSRPWVRSGCSPWIVASSSLPESLLLSSSGEWKVGEPALAGIETRPVLVPGSSYYLSVLSSGLGAEGSGDLDLEVQLTRGGDPVLSVQIERTTKTSMPAGTRQIDVAFLIPPGLEGLYELRVRSARSGDHAEDLLSPPIEVWIDRGDGIGSSCPTWTGLRRRAVQSDGLEGQRRVVIESASARKQRAAIRDAYLEVLASMASSGDLAKAVERLGETEAGIIDSAPGFREILLQVEVAVAQELAVNDPECILPVLMLHHEGYEEHYRKGRFGLAGHSRLLIGQLTGWVLREGLVEENSRPLADLLTSLAEYAESHFMMFESQILLRTVLGLHEDHEAARLLLALSYERVGFHDRARDELVELLSYNSKSMETRLRLAVMLARAGDYEPSIEQLRRLIRERPADWLMALGYQTLAQSLGRLDRLDEAVSTLRQAIGRLPNEQRLYIQLAYWLDRSGRRDEALEILEALPYGTGSTSSHRLRYTEHTGSSIEPLRRELATNVGIRLPRLAAAVAGVREEKKR